MKQVTMLRDEIVSWGPQRLFKDKVVELPDDLAASLVGRAIAVYTPPERDETIKHIEVVLELPTQPLSEIANLSSMTKAELVELAKETELSGYGTMNKAELVEALGKLKV